MPRFSAVATEACERRHAAPDVVKEGFRDGLGLLLPTLTGFAGRALVS